MHTGIETTTTPRAYEGLDRIFVGGRWREGHAGKRRVDHDPWTGETLLESSLADAGDVDEAYRAAAIAWRRWWNRLPQERAAVLSRAVALMDARKDEITDWIRRESGGTRAKAELEWRLARTVTAEAVGIPTRMAGSIMPTSARGMESLVVQQPVGVVTVISPFNFPWQLSMRSVVPALACGNAVVLKPSSDTPVCGGTLLGKLFEEAGVPPGVLQILVGSGRDIGDAIVDHPVPRVVSFTGSIAVGQHVGEICGRRVKKVCLELGGNGPFVVFDDADLEAAVHAAIFGKFSHQGQICMAVNRILVQRDAHDEFLDRFVEATRALLVGEYDDPRTTIGPIINEKQKDAILDRVRRTEAAGARVVLDGAPRGLVVPPIVLADVTNDMPCAREENFGPVAPVIAFDSEDEGIALANDTEAGLSAGVFSEDLRRGLRAARRIEAGMVHVNGSPVADEANTAFGGVKKSGIGRFGGRWAVEEFTEWKWISVREG